MTKKHFLPLHFFFFLRLHLLLHFLLLRLHFFDRDLLDFDEDEQQQPPELDLRRGKGLASGLASGLVSGLASGLVNGSRSASG